MPDVPLLVLTAPSRGVDGARDDISRARESGADVVELRIDRWPESERGRVGELFPAPLPLMATLRSRTEGGEGPDDPEARRATLLAVARSPFRWMDLEEARDLPIAHEFPSDPAPLLVASAHLPGDTSPAALVDRLRRPLPPRTIRKIVLPANLGRLLGEILPTLRAAGTSGAVVLTTGPSGPLLRAWAPELGYPLVYAAPRVVPGPSLSEKVEASQVPVDRLRWYFEGPVRSLYAILGRPVAHSQSPYLHARWMRAHGHHGLYVPLEVASETEFVEALEPLAARGLYGANVTHPWKMVALASATRVARGAEVCGAANCLTFHDGEIEAENTDLAAALRRLEELRDSGRWTSNELVVLGSGGSAAATLAAARELRAEAYVMARSAEKAAALSARFESRRLPAEEIRPFSLVVHATDVGRADADRLELPLSKLVNSDTVVLDWVYAAADDVVRRTVLGAGGTYEDGWRLLVYQAAASFGIWWGDAPDAEEIDRTIREGPCAA